MHMVTYTNYTDWKRRVMDLGGYYDGVDEEHGDHTAYNRKGDVIGNWSTVNQSGVLNVPG